MNTQDLLSELDRRGVVLALTPFSIRYAGPAGAMTPALRAALVANKAEVRALLQARHTPRPAQSGAIPQENGPGSAQDPPGYRKLAARLELARDLPDPALIGDIETAMEDHLAIMAEATGCAEDTAEELLTQFDQLIALYSHGLALAVDGDAQPERLPGDPPPIEPCKVSDDHRRFWRRPAQAGGGWVCALCHPPTDGLEVETYTIPGDGQPLPHLVGEGVYQEALL